MDGPEYNSKLLAPVTHTVSINTSREKLWGLLATPGVLEICHPFCKRNPVERWPGVGSRDRLIYYSDLVLVRDFTAWVDGVGYDLVARDAQGGEWPVRWLTTSSSELTSELTITIRPCLENPTPRKAAQWTRLIDRYLEQAMAGMKSYCETGAPVVRNQFGSHPLFSPSVPTE